MTPGAKNSRNDNNNKTQKKGTKKSGASNTDNTARNIKEQTPPSTVGGGSGLVSALNIFDDIGEINFPRRQAVIEFGRRYFVWGWEWEWATTSQPSAEFVQIVAIC